jgi:glycerophosphoryl diester phosphodiesterase
VAAAAAAGVRATTRARKTLPIGRTGRGAAVVAPSPRPPVPVRAFPIRARVIGHRGAAALAPENTLAGLRRAAELGLAWVEIDLRLTADGAPVLLHDATLRRTAGARTALVRLSRARLAGLDAGSWFAPGFADESVPDLSQALALAGELGLGLNLEIKAPRGRGGETMAAVLDVLTRSRADPGRILLSSFDRAALRRAAGGLWPLGVLMGRPPSDWRRFAAGIGAVSLHCDHRRLDARWTARLRDSGLPVLAYTVNDRRRAETLFAWGVTAVITDRPDALAGLAKRADGK